MSSSSSVDRVSQRTNRTGHYLLLLSLIFGSVLAQSLGAQGIFVLYPFIQNEFGLSHAQVGLITSSQAIGLAATVVLAGWLTDSLGVKRMTTIALVSVTVLTLSFPLAFSFAVVLALSVLLGIATSPLYPATTRAIMDWFPGRIRALAMSFKQSGFPVGGALTAVLLPVLSIAVGWRMAAAATGLIVLAITIAFKLLYRDAPRKGATTNKFSFVALKAIFRNRSRVATLVWGAMFVGFQYVVVTYFMLFLIEEMKLSAIMAGGMLAVAQVSSSFSRILWGAVSDFIFHGKRVAVLAIIGFLTVAWMLGTSTVSAGIPTIAIFLFAAVIGVSTLSFHGVLTTLIGELAEPEQVGVTVGVAAMMMHIGQMVIPPIFGLLVDTTGSYGAGWSLMAALAMVCTLALVALGREPQRGQLAGFAQRELVHPKDSQT